MKIKKYSEEYREGNKEEIARKAKIRNADPKNKLARRIKHLKEEYNMTLEDFDKMVNSHENSCAICHKHQSQLNKLLSIDHDHSTGKIRGLLCFDCNVGIGKLGDDIQILKSAIEYLTHHSI